MLFRWSLYRFRTLKLFAWRCFFPLVKLCWPVFIYQVFLICFSLVIINWFGLLSLSLTSAKSLSLWSESLCRLIDCNEIWRIHKDGWDLTGSRKPELGISRISRTEQKKKKKKADLRWLGSALPYPPLRQIRTLISPQSGIPVWSRGDSQEMEDWHGGF